MMKNKVLWCMLLASCSCNGAEYVGKLGTVDIMASFTEGEYVAAYMYNAFRTPIPLVQSNASTDAQWVYSEKIEGKESAVFTLNKKGNDLIGFWLNKKTNQKLPVTLSRYNEARGEMQSSAFKNSYVRVRCDDAGKRVTLIDKKTDKSIITMNAEGVCQRDELEVDDYNFDGFEDFSVFESYYAGPNTTRLYYLYTPKSKKYVYSDQLALTSLDFDHVKKIVTSTNQCCAGASITIDTYKWQGSKLKWIGGECHKRSDAGKDIVKPRRACD